MRVARAVATYALSIVVLGLALFVRLAALATTALAAAILIGWACAARFTREVQ